jgi:RNA polymerase sigma-70 factor (ECF subfamily)
MAEATDIDLIESYTASGEIRHFDDLVRRHAGKVRAMIYPMVMNHADADEVTQEVFLRAFRGIQGFRKKAQFSSWLYRITMNTTHSFLRARSRNPVQPHEEVPEGTVSHASPSEALLGKELSSDIEKALLELAPKLRSAIVLVGIEGMDTREAAKAEGCLPATMYWRVHEARRLLKKAWAGGVI